MSEPHPQTLPAPEQQAVIDKYPLCASLTVGKEYTFTTSHGYSITAIYRQTLPDGCLYVQTKDGVDGFVNPLTTAVVVLAAVSARA